MMEVEEEDTQDLECDRLSSGEEDAPPTVLVELHHCRMVQP